MDSSGSMIPKEVFTMLAMLNVSPSCEWTFHVHKSGVKVTLDFTTPTTQHYQTTPWMRSNAGEKAKPDSKKQRISSLDSKNQRENVGILSDSARIVCSQDGDSSKTADTEIPPRAVNMTEYIKQNIDGVMQSPTGTFSRLTLNDYCDDMDNGRVVFDELSEEYLNNDRPFITIDSITYGYAKESNKIIAMDNKIRYIEEYFRKNPKCRHFIENYFSTNTDGKNTFINEVTKSCEDNIPDILRKTQKQASSIMEEDERQRRKVFSTPVKSEANVTRSANTPVRTPRNSERPPWSWW